MTKAITTGISGRDDTTTGCGTVMGGIGCIGNIYRYVPKEHILSIVGIKKTTFNTGHAKFLLQFKVPHHNVASYIQDMLTDEGHYVMEIIHVGIK